MGTRFVAEALSNPARLFPFQFSDQQAYALELGQATCARWLLGGAVLEEELQVIAITKASTRRSRHYHGYSVGEQVYLKNIEGMVEINDRWLTVLTVIDAAQFHGRLRQHGAGRSPDRAGDRPRGTPRASPPPPPSPRRFPTQIRRRSVPVRRRLYDDGSGGSRWDGLGDIRRGKFPDGRLSHLSDRLAVQRGRASEIDYEQTADVLYLAHENHKPNKLIRAGHASWSFNDVPFGPTIAAPTGVGGSATHPNTDAANAATPISRSPQPMSSPPINEDTGQESRASSSVTLTNSISEPQAQLQHDHMGAVTGATNYRVYCAENSQLYGYIGTTDQLTFRDDNIGPDLSQGPPIGDNPFASAGDYPATITFHEQRACWGRTINRPNGIWFSRSADYENMDFTRPSRADDSFPIGLVANKVNSVNQLVVTSRAGGSDQPQHLRRPGIERGLYLRRSAAEGQAGDQPRRVAAQPDHVDNVIFYEGGQARGVRTIGYEFEMDGLKTDDVTIFSRHLFENQGSSTGPMPRNPPRRSGSSARRRQAAVPDLGSGAAGVGLDALRDRRAVQARLLDHRAGRGPGLLPRRAQIKGVTKLYVERMASELWQDQKPTPAISIARGPSSTMCPVSHVDRLDHLEGKTVKAWVDGQAITQNNGSRWSSPTARSIFRWRLCHHRRPAVHVADRRRFPLAFQAAADGRSPGRSRRRVILKVVNSRNIQAGPDEDSLFPVKQRYEEGLRRSDCLLKTGDFEVQMAGTSQDETVVVVKSDDPCAVPLAAILVEPKRSGASGRISFRLRFSTSGRSRTPCAPPTARM
jgi:hypothetical protein